MKQKERSLALQMVSEEAQHTQLELLRDVLVRAKCQPFKREIAPALLRMLAANQILCRMVRCDGGKREVVFVANVVAADIGQLLPLVTYPVVRATLNLFLNNQVFIFGLHGGERNFRFGTSAELLHVSQPGAGDRNEADGALLDGRQLDAISEDALRRFLHVSNPSSDGWLRLCINGQSIGVKRVSGDDAPLAYRSLEEFGTDIVVVAWPEVATNTVHLLGWTDKDFFTREHETVEHYGVTWYSLPKERLYYMDGLKELADRTSICPLQ